MCLLIFVEHYVLTEKCGTIRYKKISSTIYLFKNKFPKHFPFDATYFKPHVEYDL